MTVCGVVKGLEGLSCALAADLEGVKRKSVSWGSHTNGVHRIASQERRNLFDQIEAQTSQIQHTSAAASRSRVAACSVLERCFSRMARQSQWVRVVFTTWRGMAERHALGACAQRAQELEDWLSCTRESNCNRISVWLDHALLDQKQTRMQRLFLFWRCASKAQVCQEARQ